MNDAATGFIGECLEEAAPKTLAAEEPRGSCSSRRTLEIQAAWGLGCDRVDDDIGSARRVDELARSQPAGRIATITEKNQQRPPSMVSRSAAR